MAQSGAAWRATYTPGRWVVLGGPRSLVVMQPAPAKMSNLLNSIWDEVQLASGISDLVSRLGAFGLERMPHFAAFYWDDAGMHSLVRGKLRVIDPTDGATINTGEEVLTWSEAGVASKIARIDMEPVDQDQLLQLPLVTGAVTASAIVIDATASTPLAFPVAPELTALQGGGEPPTDSQPRTPFVPVVVPAGPDPAQESALDPGDNGLDDGLHPEISAAPADLPGLSADPVDETDDFVDEHDPLAAPTSDFGAVPTEPVDESIDTDAPAATATGQIEAITDSTPAPEQFVADAAPSTPEAVAAEPAAAEPAAPVAPAPAGFPPAPAPEPVASAPAVSPPVPAPASAPSAPPMPVPGVPAAPAPFGGPGVPPPPVAGAPIVAHPGMPVPGAAMPAPGTPMAPYGQPQQGQFAPGQPQPGQPQPGQFGTQVPGGPGGPVQVPGGFPPQPGYGQPAPGQPSPGHYGQPAPGQPMPGQFGQPAPYGAPPAPQFGQPAPQPPAQPVQGQNLQGQHVQGQNLQGQQAWAPATAAPVEDEHDGHTIFVTGLAATHKPAAGSRGSDDGLVLASMCASGHANPPGSPRCRLCPAPVDAHNPRLVNRPSLATLRTSSGDAVDVVGPVLIGRAPSTTGQDPTAITLKVPSPSSDISRNHVKVAADQWNLTVTDLHSTNGTVVLHPGEQPTRLNEGESVTIQIGAVLDLGDGVTIEVAPPS